ncbi:uncharacterized protein LOC132203209 isoform X2 [Neocloeon triangulifer]|uniref:uncharacterized protein LOC132203209 isoform X2 n=1 Tax=Neocloeon triangulifer TaxID=2078957 RepID=UPI00286EE175|nr:uncharacterized protein LOC132203209 isoform X2 [Neocloeon triangulifer]
MFHGNFKEARNSPDDEILMDDTDPQVFEVAMRFIYGRKAYFQNAIIAALVCKFAHKWQIDNLMNAANSFILLKLSHEWVTAVPVYEILKNVGNKEVLVRCMEVISSNTREVVTSSTWENASLDLVMDVLNQEQLSIDNECDLLEALVQWGKAQVQKRNEELSDSKIFDMLSCESPGLI